MHAIYDYNNLPFWTEDQIVQKQSFVSLFEHDIRAAFQERNRAWFFERIESPILIPRDLLSEEYNERDIYIIPEQDPSRKILALRPETTPATYAWMQHRLLSKNMLPYACWQVNKSFRREQDQPTKHVRLKEFYQQEFQCVYMSDSFEDWQQFIVPHVKSVVEKITHCPTRIVVSDRLPSYSVCTIDIEVWNSDKWMEICSISKRIDFSCKWDRLLGAILRSNDHVSKTTPIWSLHFSCGVVQDRPARSASVENDVVMDRLQKYIPFLPFLTALTAINAAGALNGHHGAPFA